MPTALEDAISHPTRECRRVQEYRLEQPNHDTYQCVAATPAAAFEKVMRTFPAAHHPFTVTVTPHRHCECVRDCCDDLGPIDCTDYSHNHVLRAYCTPR